MPLDQARKQRLSGQPDRRCARRRPDLRRGTERIDAVAANDHRPTLPQHRAVEYPRREQQRDGGTR